MTVVEIKDYIEQEISFREEEMEHYETKVDIKDHINCLDQIKSMLNEIEEIPQDTEDGDDLSENILKEPVIIKKETDTFFINFHANSKRGEKILSKEPRLYFGKGNYDHYAEKYKDIYKPVEIIQMWKLDGMELLAEVKWKEANKDSEE